MMIVKFLKKPHVIFWSFVLMLLLLSFYQDDQTLDINVHDTYFVFSQQQILILISLFLGFTGLIYWIIERYGLKTSVVLNILHLILTIGILIINGIRSAIGDHFIGERYYENTYIPDSSVWIFIFIIIIGQFVFIINIILSIIKGKSYKTKVQ